MPTYYETGRTRTLTFSGNITARLLLGLEGTGPSENSYYAYPETLSISAFSFLTVTAAMDNFVVNPDIVLGYEVLARLTVNASCFGDTDSDNTTFSDGPSGTDVEVSQSLNGTYSLSIPVEEVFWVEDSSPRDSFGFPSHGGTAAQDGPYGRVIRFGERPVESSTATATITMGGITATVNHAITALEASSLVTHFATASGRSAAYDLLGTYLPSHELTITGDFGEDSFSVPYNPSDTTHEVDCNSGLYVKAAPNTADSLIYTDGGLTVYAVRRYGLVGRQRQLTAALSPEIDWKIQAKDTTVVTGNDSYTWNEEKYDASASFNGSAQTGLSLDEFGYVWVALDTTDLAASDEDPADWRCLILGHLWNCYDISHSDETLTNTTSEWAAGANTTVSAGVALAVSGGAGEATYTPPANVDAEGFRYLEITLSSTSNTQPFTVEIGSKTWDVTTGVGSTVVQIDLCAPHNAASTTDNKASRYPLDAAPTAGVPVDSDYWGVSDIDEIVLSGLVDGQTYTVTKLELVSDSRLEVSVLSSFDNWQQAWMSGLDTTKHKPFFWCNADGRFADNTDMFFVDVVPSGDYYSPQSLDLLKGQVNTLGGWSMVNGAHSLPSDGYHDRDKNAYWLCGAGATYNYATSTWTDWIDRSVSTTLTLPAQPGWDMVEVYGGAGNVWTGAAAYPTTSATVTPLAVCKILRARGWGLLLDENKDPASGETVTLEQSSDASSRGTDTSETDGYFYTGTPFGFAPRSHTIKAGSRSVSITTANRMLHRGVLVVSASSGGVAYVNHRDGMHYRSYINASGKVVSERSDNLLSWNGEETTIDADWVYLSHSYEGYSVVYLLYTDGGVVYRRTSADGVSWGMASTISTGSSNQASAQADLPGGRNFAYWVDSTGAIKGTEYDNGGNTVGTTAFSTGITGVDSVSFFARWNDYGQGRGRVVIQCTISGVVTQYTSADGRTFS